MNTNTERESRAALIEAFNATRDGKQEETKSGEAFTIKEGTKPGAIEIYFTAKPSEEAREALKGLKMRWNGAKKCWYGFASAAVIASALGENQPAEERKAEEVAAKPEQLASLPKIRFYWNGLKVGDSRALVKCGYSNAPKKGEPVTIYGRDYNDLPRGYFTVTNDTDSYADYFCDDCAEIPPTHPLYKYIFFAAWSASMHYEIPYTKKLGEEIEAIESGKRREPWRGHLEAIKADYARRMENIKTWETMENPGQPTNADLLAIERQQHESETAAAEQRKQEELAAREAYLNERAEGARLIREEQKAHPIKDGAPVVHIEWSECPAFYFWNDKEATAADALLLSIPAAENILKQLDEKSAARGRGYYKTSFKIYQGAESVYNGRYDLGDNDGGLIQHIATFGEWVRTHGEWGNNNPSPERIEEGESILKFAESLQAYCQ